MADNPIKIDHKVLRSLHRIQQELADIKGKIKRGPRQIAAGKANADAAAAELEVARESLKRAKMGADEKQLQLKGREQRVADLDGKLNAAATNKEFQLIKDQIAADQKANGVLSDEIFEALETIDELTVVVADKEAVLEQAQSDHAKLAKDVEGRMEIWNQELHRSQEELATVEKELPSSSRDVYKRCVEGAGEDGLAMVEGESCGCCGTTFSPQNMNQLLLSYLVVCPGCAAILYTVRD